MQMTQFEEKRFELVVIRAEDTVVVEPLRQRETCPKCHQILSSELSRLWHQFVHMDAYNGFLDGKFQIQLPDFEFVIPCPFSTCSLLFLDLIDARFHYLLEHQSCQLFCCGVRFSDYKTALEHLQGTGSVETEAWDQQKHFLKPVYICNCCNRTWSSRNEYVAHLHGRDHMCPDPVCKYIFETNEKCIRHFFEQHYKHLFLDSRHLLLNYKYFLRYQEKQEERAYGLYVCTTCQRRFRDNKGFQSHVASQNCEFFDRKFFVQVIACKCGHQFKYCYYQRDVLLRNLPVLREAMEHVEREAPFNNMPEDVCNIYRSIIVVIIDVNQRLINEKFTNYQRTSPLKHSSFTPRQMAKLLLEVVDYFWKIM